jgi:nicotinate-nucleotide pyrophosphorylase (carboxylating)
VKIDWEQADRLIELALAEDVGEGDITTGWTVSEKATACADLVAKEAGVIAGTEVAGRVFRHVDTRITFEVERLDGTDVSPGDRVGVVAGPARGILTAERTVLNFLKRMSGIATMTSHFVKAVTGTKAAILDTRKTLPGHRTLDKYSVTVGGGKNHRIGLYDMVLLKENHIEAADGIGPAIHAVKQAMAQSGRKVKIEVEVETLRQLDDALASGVDYVLLDNMAPETMREAAALVSNMGNGRPMLEASGNVTLETVREVADSGVDLVSVGALTHSVKALDLSLLFR